MSIENTLERIAAALEKIAENRQFDSPTEIAPPTLSPTPAAAPAPAAQPVAPVTPGVPTIPQAQAPQVPVTLTTVPTLDDIRALATDFHRAHPERASEVVGILSSVGAVKLTDIKPDQLPAVHSQLKALVETG